MITFSVKVKTPQGDVLRFSALGPSSMDVYETVQESSAERFGVCGVAVTPLRRPQSPSHYQ